MAKNESSNNKEKNANSEQNYIKIYSRETNKNSNNSLNNNNNKNAIRKDAKGIPIIKKQEFVKKSKHHAYLKDEIYPGQNFANIIDIPSYKKYNIDSDAIEEEDEDEGQINNESGIELNKEMYKCQCCIII